MYFNAHHTSNIIHPKRDRFGQTKAILWFKNNSSQHLLQDNEIKESSPNATVSLTLVSNKLNVPFLPLECAHSWFRLLFTAAFHLHRIYPCSAKSECTMNHLMGGADLLPQNRICCTLSQSNKHLIENDMMLFVVNCSRKSKMALEF